MEPELITVDEAAALVGVDPRTIRRWYRKLLITKYKNASGAVRVDAHEIRRHTRMEPAVPAQRSGG